MSKKELSDFTLSEDSEDEESVLDYEQFCSPCVRCSTPMSSDNTMAYKAKLHSSRARSPDWSLDKVDKEIRHPPEGFWRDYLKDVGGDNCKSPVVNQEQNLTGTDSSNVHSVVSIPFTNLKSSSTGKSSTVFWPYQRQVDDESEIYSDDHKNLIKESSYDALNESFVDFLDGKNFSGNHNSAELQDNLEKRIFVSNHKSDDQDSEIRDDYKEFFATLPSDHKVLRLKFPPVVSQPSVHLPFHEVDVSTTFPFFIAEIYSPIHFWFHYDYDVLNLMDKLRDFYLELNKNDLEFSRANIKPGLLVAAQYNGEWHRAEVISVSECSEKVRVFFLDYGTVANISANSIKYLLRSFLKYPRYALRGCLSNLRPPKNETTWSPSAVYEIIKNFGDKELKGQVLKVHQQNSVYELHITYGEEQRSLRDWITDQMMAEKFDVNSNHFAEFDNPSFEWLERDRSNKKLMN